MRATQYTSATALRNAKSARCTVVQATRRELGLQLLTVGMSVQPDTYYCMTKSAVEQQHAACHVAACSGTVLL